MAYTIDQLVQAYTAVHAGIAPDTATRSSLQTLATQNATGQLSDAQVLSSVVNSGDSTTALAVLSYEFFTGKSPTQAGLAYLVNSPSNPSDLNDAYYGGFNIENRYINFAANLGIQGEGAASFASKYGAMSYATFVSSIYQTIVGSAYATAAGIDPAKAIADIVSRQAAIQATATSAGMIRPGMTAAQIDLAVKAATAGYLLGEAVKADVGIYASAANNFSVALATGTAVYNTDVVQTYAKPAGQTGGGGQAVTGTVTLPSPPVPNEPPATPQAFVLTTGVDLVTGGGADDTFTGTNLTFNATDTLNGGGGNDTLTINVTGIYTAAAATISGIETANIVNNNIVTANTTTWTGLTQLNVTSVGGDDLTAASTTNVTLNASSVGSNNVFIRSGKDVTLNETGLTSGDIFIGGTTPITGAVVLNVSAGGVSTRGSTEVTGGTTVTINQTATNAVNTTQTNSDVTVHGRAMTTAVTIKAPTAATADGSTAGIVANTVIITDVNAGSSTLAGTITSIDVDSFTSLNIADTALTTLKVAHGSGNIILDNSSLTTPTNKTLNLTVSGQTGGTLDDADVYTTLNITTGAENSTLANITTSAVTAITLAGSSTLKLNSTAGLSALQTLTVTGAAGITANLSGATVKAINASATSGANTVTIDSNKASYDGGSGVDTVVLAATAAAKNTTLGGGNDILDTTALTTVNAGVTFDAGAGTADVLKVTAAGAQASSGTATFANTFLNFERLELTGSTNQTIDVAILGPYHYVTTSGGNGLTLNNFSSGDTLVLNGAGTAYTIGAGNMGGATDSLNVILTDGSTAGVAFATTGITATGVETANITTADTQGTPSGSFNDTLTWLGNNVKTINVTGNAGLTLTASSTALTTVDASGITLGGFTWTSGALAAAAAIKGSAAGTNTVNFSAAVGGIVTYTGGTGNDIVNGSNGQSNVVHLGAGNNSFVGTTGGMTIDAGLGNDTVTVTSGNNSVNLGNGTNTFTATSGDNTYTGGTGVDTITVGGGQNGIDVGSGNDLVNITAANAASNTIFTSITGFGTGDKLAITPGGSLAPTAVGAEITGQASLAAYLDAAAAADGSGTAVIHWFQFSGDTYVVQDLSAGATFVAGTDIVVKLVGTVSLAASTVTAGQITI